MLELIDSDVLKFVFLFSGAFLLTLFTLPRVRENSLKFGFYDEPDYRSSHKDIVPTFGGVAFYVVLLFTVFVSQGLDNTNLGLTLIFSISVMFFVGLKDDLQNLTLKMKLLGQFIAVGLLLSQPDFRVASLHGFLGIYQLPELISIVLSVFITLGIINAFNLIDGIDGMASIVGIVILSSFGVLFYNLGLLYYVAICVSSVAMLIAFLRFNFSSRKKIFMGDTGALVLGLILGLMTMKLLSQGSNAFQMLAIGKGEIPLLLIGILFIPTFDVARVMIVRLLKKQSISTPDRNHIHHVLVDTGLSHKRASVICGVLNIFTVLIMFYSIRYLGVWASLIVLALLVSLFILAFFGMNKNYHAKRAKVKVRNTLFKISVSAKKRKSSETNIQQLRLAFNEKLKKIRILFF
jgi:UDP-GlcNAc:undecaprenyl-phosphate/decaprenyl-phosphate GlcNAc-1-phosphate transferase